MKLYLESLGCARNQVDSEIMLGRLTGAGWCLTDDPAEADAIVVNTCSFIESAAQESVDVILELAEYRRRGRCSRLVVTGCLPERYRQAIRDSLPEVDVFLGTGAFDQIVEAATRPRFSADCLLPDPNLARTQSREVPRHLSLPHLAYLKIAEGCSKACTYCIIPRLRGKQKSRPAEDILNEARLLAASGVKEIVLVAQDSTAYGSDLTPSDNLADLITRLAHVSSIEGPQAAGPWLRVLYGHPESIDERFIEAVSACPSVCPYFDIPIQHASPGVLKRMGRNYSLDDLYRLFDVIRSRVPEAVLRTTIIVGFPGETEADFEMLLKFIEDIRFDHLGAFVYSDAEDLASHRLSDHIGAEAARERYHELMSAQMDISTENNSRYIGQAVKVLVEESLGNDLYAGRTPFQAPEVDGISYINAAALPFPLKIGDFADMRITDAMEYDLMGEGLWRS